MARELGYGTRLGFTRAPSALVTNQAGINAFATCAHEYPPAKRRRAKESKDRNTSRVIVR